MWIEINIKTRISMIQYDCINVENKICKHFLINTHEKLICFSYIIYFDSKFTFHLWFSAYIFFYLETCISILFIKASVIIKNGSLMYPNRLKFSEKMIFSVF